MVKNLPTNETQIQTLALEDPLKEGMEIHSSIIAWSIPWTEEPGGQQFMGHNESDITEATEHTLCSEMLLH